jgi:hypothetical protein
MNPPKANGCRFLTDGRWLTSLGETVETLGEKIRQYEKTVGALVLRDIERCPRRCKGE